MSADRTYLLTVIQLVAQTFGSSSFAMEWGHERFLDDTERITRAGQRGRDRLEGIAELTPGTLLIAHLIEGVDWWTVNSDNAAWTSTKSWGLTYTELKIRMKLNRRRTIVIGSRR
jgi:hypothetical protein